MVTSQIHSTQNTFLEKCEYVTPQIIQNHPKKAIALGIFLVVTGLYINPDEKDKKKALTQEGIAWLLIGTGASLGYMGHSKL